LAKSNQTTLCYIERDGQYLMMHRVKKEHDINKDKWVGIGGHFEQDESPEECLLRETREETGLTLTDYRLRGVITFISDKWQTEYMFLYTATGYEGEIGDCNEGTLEWIDRTDVYDLPIWAGDRIFFRLLEWRQDFFSLKLRYVGEQLTEVMLDGQAISPENAALARHMLK
jgi:8-oxo-dGTP diphosphatase